MYLNCYSKVTVKFPVPVLNETTAKIPETFGTTETSETAKYCHMLDQFFDCLNVRSLEKHQKKTKLFLKQYINENVKRFSWMTNQFLSCPNTWEKILETGEVISLKMLDPKCLSVYKHIMAYKSL